MKRWLWGLLLVGLGLLVAPGRLQGKAGVGSLPAVAGAAAGPQVHIPPFAAPSSMPALGEELARGLYAALRDANIPARLGKSEEGSAIVGRLEEVSPTQVRLQASYRGHSAQSVGDLEHLDDLIFAVFTQLRPRLQAAGSDSRSGALLPPPASEVPATEGPNKASPATRESAKPAAPATPIRLASIKEPTPASPLRPSPSHRPTEVRLPPPPPIEKDREKDKDKDKEPVVSVPPSLPSPPMVHAEPPVSPEPHTPPPPVPAKSPNVITPRPALAPFTFEPRRPRVAVHVVGDPMVRIPAGYAGLGTVGQQSLIGYLQQRLRVPAVASRLVGLTGGLVALDQALRVGARHSLMVRLDSLVLTASPSSGVMGTTFTGGTLSGRIHIVLLLDGKLLYDRSVMLPPTLVLASDSAALSYSRSLTAAMDSVAGELAGRLTEAPPSPTSSPGGPH